MWDQYGKAVVEERTQPQNLAELRNYLRMEFGLGTGPGFLLREVSERARRSRGRVRAALGRAIRLLARAVRTLPESIGRPPNGGAAHGTR